MSDGSDVLQSLLMDGWEIAGYSTVIMAAGAMVHSVLMRKNTEVRAVNVVINNGKEIGRTEHPLTPAPQKAKGLWS